jgi:hypothetical protein
VISFWYSPRPNISADGRWVLFTSNWEKTLGTDPTGDASTKYRQDAFVVELASSIPPPPPVAFAATALPGGRATVPYSAAVSATGGQGTYAWTVSSGSLPAGLSLDSSTGVISGTPLAAGAYSFTVSVADAAAPANSASGAVTISIGASPVAIATASLNAGRALVVYGGHVAGLGRNRRVYVEPGVGHAAGRTCARSLGRDFGDSRGRRHLHVPCRGCRSV